jgi:hypothetical protein
MDNAGAYRATTYTDVKNVEGLCLEVAKLCRIVGNRRRPSAQELAEAVPQPNPDMAALKRRSMDLTRALARLRGRGRF